MISKEEFEKAQEVITKYKTQINKEYIKNAYTCICCKKKEVTFLFEKDIEYMDPLRQDQIMWNFGTVGLVNFGYGSKHDMSSYFFAICDDCIETLEKENKVVNWSKLRKKIENI